ncbi:hypothetical protein [Olsenella massiliensis]|uniref:hypothetical protein n=1 Tax=Olsenella massiliensis TaxID=1622075 RepID=UPI0009E8A87A|nr:hypothetical protein [Olsenella massiliensis]
MERVACIDVGTVTARLAVADLEGGIVRRLAKSSTICNLGEGLAASGRISSAARRRVSACVDGYLRAARSAGAAHVCCTPGSYTHLDVYKRQRFTCPTPRTSVA